MKKLFAVFMSLHLILAPVAFAQEDKYKTEGSGGKGYDFVVNQVLNIATSTIGANIMTECYQGLMMPSIATFMAGSLVNVVAEIAGAKHKNNRDQLKLKELQELEKKIKDEKDSSQVSSMESLLTAEEENLAFIESRKKWTMATTIIYAAAMGLAIAEEVYGLASATTLATTVCTTATTTAASCASGAAIAAITAAIAPDVATAVAQTAKDAATVIGPEGIAAAEAGAATASTGLALTAANTALHATCTTACNTYPVPAGCAPAIAAYVAGVGAECAAGTLFIAGQMKAIATVGMSGARTLVSEACALYSPYSAGCFAQGNTYLTAAYGACGEVSKSGNASSMLMGALLLAAYGFGNKSGGAISTYGSMAAVLVPSLIKGTGAFIARAYSFPIPRAVTFGAIGALSGVLTYGMAKKADQANENIVALKNAIVRLKKQTNGASSGIEQDLPEEDKSGGPAAILARKASELKKFSLLKKKECLSQSGGEHSAGACGRPFRLATMKFGKFNTPALNKVGALAGDMARALINGDENGAAKLGDEIGSYAARVKAETESLQKLYNEGEKNAGRPTKDFNKSIKAQVAAMQAQVQQAAKSAGVNLNSMASASTDAPKDDGKGDTAEITTASAPVVGAPAAAVDPLAGLGTEEAVVEDPSAIAATGKGEQSLDEFESTVQDINKQPEVSIFKQLSNRYILNYTKMFDRKQAPEAAPAVSDPPKN